ncbi:kinesin-like protein, partial [Kipferlia bialata]
PKDGKISVEKNMGETKSFYFDFLFGPKSNTKEVFEASSSPVVIDTLNGYNGCIMVYGQTGTGKSFTLSNFDPSNHGVIFRAMDQIFEVKRSDLENEYKIEVSYVQIYCEMIEDLLEPGKKGLSIREDPDSGVYIANVSKFEIDSSDECLQKLEDGNSMRAVANTQMNAVSSRSHACLITYITKRKRITEADYEAAMEAGEKVDPKKGCTNGKLTLVDLAGSERMKRTGATGARAAEGKAINMSLTALGNVIHALSDSKIHHDSLGGNSKTSLIVCISAAADSAPETISSLSFADRAMKVAQKAVRNVTIDYKALALKLQARLDGIDEEINTQLAKVLAAQTEVTEVKLERDDAVRAMEEATLRLRSYMANNGIAEQELPTLAPAPTPETDMDSCPTPAAGASSMMKESESPAVTPTAAGATLVGDSTPSTPRGDGEGEGEGEGVSARAKARQERAKPEPIVVPKLEPLEYREAVANVPRIPVVPVLPPSAPPPVSDSVTKADAEALLAKAVDAHRKDIARMREFYESHLADVKREYERAMDENSISLRELGDERRRDFEIIKDLEAAVHDAREEAAEYTEQLAEIEGQTVVRLGDVVSEAKELEFEVADLRSDNSRLQKELDKVTEEFEALEDKAETLEQDLGDANEKLEDLEEEEEDLRTQLDERGDALQQAREDLAEAEAEAEEAKDALADAEEEQEDLEAELETAKEALETAQSDAADRIADLEAALAELRDELQDA